MRGGVIYVDQNAEDEAGNTYRTIQEALKHADDGYTIEIAEGNYDISNLGINVAVNLKGKNTYERAELLISIAHPDFRDELTEAAKRMGIWRDSSKVQK